MVRHFQYPFLKTNLDASAGMILSCRWEHWGGRGRVWTPLITPLTFYTSTSEVLYIESIAFLSPGFRLVQETRRPPFPVAVLKNKALSDVIRRGHRENPKAKGRQRARGKIKWVRRTHQAGGVLSQ